MHERCNIGKIKAASGFTVHIKRCVKRFNCQSRGSGGDDEFAGENGTCLRDLDAVTQSKKEGAAEKAALSCMYRVP
jgi:hypothetical protein